MIPPNGPWHQFLDDDEKLQYLRQIGLIPKTLDLRPIYYTGAYTDGITTCDVAGYIDSCTLVISLNGELHCIHPDLLNDMQPERRKLEKFVAIDFETATSSRDSACAIGITAVKNLEVEERFHSLLRPPENRYDEKNMDVHHITSKETEDSPTLTELWPQISRFFDENILVVAHNAPFDMSVLLHSTDVEIPNFTYVDSIDLVSPVLKESSKTLVNCAKALGITCDNHHNAQCDADVCASIVLALLAKAQCSNLREYLETLEDRGKPKSFKDLKLLKKMPQHGGKKSYPDAVRISQMHATVDEIDPNNPLFEKYLVFTGNLSISREEAVQIALNCGAFVRNRVTGKVDYLVEGEQNEDLVGEDGRSAKQRKADELNSSGAGHIVFLTEDKFLSLAKGVTTV